MVSKKLLAAYKTAVDNADPYKLIKSGVTVDNLTSTVNFFGNKINLSSNFNIIGFGKAVCGMGRALQEVLGKKITNGVLSVPENLTEVLKPPLKIFKGAKNNLPDENSMFATQEIISLVKAIEPNDVLLVLISGGGSSLLCQPAEGLLLSDKLKTIQLLTQSGADICELNSVRKKLSSVKGGGLALLCPNKITICLILSDVINDPIDVIASGPMVFNCSSSDFALDVITKYRLNSKIPQEALDIIMKPRNLNFNTPNTVTNILIGTNKKSLNAVKEKMETNTFRVIVGSSTVQGNVMEISDFYATLAEETLKLLSNSNKQEYEDNLRFLFHQYPLIKINDNFVAGVVEAIHSKQMETLCFVFGGETTVFVRGNGKGGRNQELSVRVAKLLFDLKVRNSKLFHTWNVAFLSAGTDGIDGPTDAAGGIGCIELIEEGLMEGKDATVFVDKNDSYTYLSEVANGKYLIQIGLTGTNVMDVHELIFYKSP